MSEEVTTGGRPWDEIRSILEVRRSERSPLISRMAQIRDRYDSDYVITDPTAQSDDVSSVLTPAIINEAIDQPALRAASVLPNVYVPPLVANRLNGKGSIDYANTRRRAIEATWAESHLQLLLRKAFRQLRAYATTCLVIQPDYRAMMPKISLRDPLTALPEPKASEDLSLPSNGGFVMSKSAGWIRSTFPAAAAIIPDTADFTELWDLIEWIDDEVIVYGVLGPRLSERPRSANDIAGSGDGSAELARFVNKAGCCGVIMPQAVSLDSAMSSIGQIIGQMDLAGQLFALEIQAVRHSIWPDRYVIGSQTGEPIVVGGTWQEGHTGKVNLLQNVQSVGELRGTPDPAVERMQDRLERNARITSGAIPQFGGEGGGALRTGRGIDTMGAWSIDGKVQELQEIMEVTLRRANEALVETYKGCYPRRKYTLMNGRSFVEFTPSKHMEDGRTMVSYAIAGADKQGTTVVLGQQLGMQLISHKTARALHPDIRDPEEEGRLVVEEKLDEALAVSILQRASTPDSPGSIPPEDVAAIRDWVRKGQPLDQAVLKVNEARQKLQAAQQATMAGGPPEVAGELEPHQMQPGMGGPSEMGLEGGPGVMQPAEAPGFGIEGPSADLDRFRMLSNAMRSPARA